MEKKDPGPSICVQFRNLWKGTYIWKRNLACVHFAISCYIVCYFGMLLNAKSFGRDRLQINTMLMGVAEICGIFIGTYFIMNKGRCKWRYTAVFNLVAVVISMCAWLVPPTSKATHIYKLECHKNVKNISFNSSGTATNFNSSLHCVYTKNCNRFIANMSGDLFHRGGNTG